MVNRPAYPHGKKLDSTSPHELEKYEDFIVQFRTSAHSGLTRIITAIELSNTTHVCRNTLIANKECVRDARIPFLLRVGSDGKCTMTCSNVLQGRSNNIIGRVKFKNRTQYAIEIRWPTTQQRRKSK